MLLNFFHNLIPRGAFAGLWWIELALLLAIAGLGLFALYVIINVILWLKSGGGF